MAKTRIAKNALNSQSTIKGVQNDHRKHYTIDHNANRNEKINISHDVYNKTGRNLVNANVHNEYFCIADYYKKYYLCKKIYYELKDENHNLFSFYSTNGRLLQL